MCGAGKWLEKVNAGDDFGKCSVCDDICKTCIGDATTCVECADGYERNDAGECVLDCHDDCLSCTAANDYMKCSTCANGLTPATPPGECP